jgi:DNA-binding MarR family transcriptional regulator
MDDGRDPKLPFPVALGYLGRDFPFMLRSLRGYIRAATTQTFTGLETEPGEIAILNLVAINPGLSQNALAAMLVLKKSAVTKAVHSLEARGLIGRRKGEDRRFNALTLTEAGVKKVTAMRERMAAQHDILFADTPAAEQDAFFEQLRRILARLYVLDRGHVSAAPQDD